MADSTICPRCAGPLGVQGGPPASCPVCEAAGTAAPAPAAGPVCPYCLAVVAEGEPSAICPACRAVYHDECWRENGGCAVYGCTQTPAVESREALSIPMSYWGQEYKPCPACNQQIMAAAVRCRHCGATFDSARPQDRSEFERRSTVGQRLPATRRFVVWLFVACVVPFSAPVGAVVAFLWYPAHREELTALPPFYRALAKIGLAAATVMTVVIVLMACLYAFIRR